MLTGIFTALITPFTQDGKIDFPSLEKLLQAQLKSGIDGFVFLGTTGEAATLSLQERYEILSFCTQYVRGKAKIIIGTGTNNTATTVELTQQATAYQPDGALVVTPYYNKPNATGLIGHYQAAAQAGIPLIMYHIPGRTGLKLPAATLEKVLQNVPQIIGIKEL